MLIWQRLYLTQLRFFLLITQFWLIKKGRKRLRGWIKSATKRLNVDYIWFSAVKAFWTKKIGRTSHRGNYKQQLIGILIKSIKINHSIIINSHHFFLAHFLLFQLESELNINNETQTHTHTELNWMGRISWVNCNYCHSQLSVQFVENGLNSYRKEKGMNSEAKLFVDFNIESGG